MTTIKLEEGNGVLELLLRCHQIAREIAGGASLSLDELFCLFALCRRKPSCLKELTRALAVRGSRTSKILDVLEGLGYLTRSLSLVDRRVEEVHLTNRGHHVIEMMIERAQEIGRDLLTHPPSPNSAALLPTGAILHASDSEG